MKVHDALYQALRPSVVRAGFERAGIILACSQRVVARSFISQLPSEVKASTWSFFKLDNRVLRNGFMKKSIDLHLTFLNRKFEFVTAHTKKMQNLSQKPTSIKTKFRRVLAAVVVSSPLLASASFFLKISANQAKYNSIKWLSYILGEYPPHTLIKRPLPSRININLRVNPLTLKEK